MGSPHAACVTMLSVEVPLVIEWRWGVITKVMSMFKDVEFLLKATFYAAKFSQQKGKAKDDKPEHDEEGPAKEAAEFDPSLCDRTLKDAHWWSYLHMLLLFHYVLEHLRTWSELCPCHGFMYKFTKGQQRNLNGLLRSIGVSTGTGGNCPVSGLRAPEVAAGDWEAAFSDLYDRAHAYLLRNIGLCSDSQLASLMHDLNLARVVIFDELKTKLNFLKCFPWRLAALAYCNEQEARDHARAIVRDWAGMDKTADKHYPLTVAVMLSEIFDDIRQFAEGVARAALHLLCKLCPELLFIPVNERTVESIFSRSSLAAVHRKVTASVVSFALRFPLREKLVQRRREPLLGTTLEAFARVRLEAKAGSSGLRVST